MTVKLIMTHMNGRVEFDALLYLASRSFKVESECRLLLPLWVSYRRLMEIISDVFRFVLEITSVKVGQFSRSKMHNVKADGSKRSQRHFQKGIILRETFLLENI